MSDVLFCSPKTPTERIRPQKLYIYCNIFTKDHMKKISDCISGKIHLADPIFFNDPFDSMIENSFDVDWFCKSSPKQIYDLIARCLSLSVFDSTNYLSLFSLLSIISFILSYNESVFVSFKDALHQINILLGDYGCLDEDDIFGKVQKHYDYMNPSISCPYRICCFAEEYDSIPLWAYYASSHKGVCIEYDISSMPNGYADYIFPVTYSSHRPNDNYSTISDSYFTKSDSWSHEKEWRIVCGGNTEFLVFSCVSAIYFGAYFLKNNQEVIQQMHDLVFDKKTKQ